MSAPVSESVIYKVFRVVIKFVQPLLEVFGMMFPVDRFFDMAGGKFFGREDIEHHDFMAVFITLYQFCRRVRCDIG